MADAPRDTAPSKLFRAMMKDEDGRPVCGDGDGMLGARVPIDIKPDKSGMVHPGKRGMSVTPDDPARLVLHFRPESLGGKGKLPVFWIETSRLGETLRYVPDERKPEKHGLVVPAKTMTLEEYRAALAATGRSWEEFK